MSSPNKSIEKQKPPTSPKEKGETAKNLESIKENALKNLEDKPLVLNLYCQNNDIDFSAWAGHLTQEIIKTEVAPALQAVGSADLAEILLTKAPGTTEYEAAKQTLNRIVEIMEERANALGEKTKEQQTLAKTVENQGDILLETLGKLKNGFLNSIRENPLLTIGASVGAIYAIYRAWDCGKKWLEIPVQIGVIGTGSALLADILTKVITGKTAMELIQNATTEEGKLNGFLADIPARVGEADNVALDPLRSMVALGTKIPFSIYLDAYEYAVRKGNDKIDMPRLRRSLRQKLGRRFTKKHEEFLNNKYGKGMFENMENLVGEANISTFRKKYVTDPQEKTGLEYNLTQVFYSEALADPSIHIAGTSSTIKEDLPLASPKKNQSQEKSKKEEAENEKEYKTDEENNDDDEQSKPSSKNLNKSAPENNLNQKIIKAIPGFNPLSPEFQKNNTVKLKGLNFSYTKQEIPEAGTLISITYPHADPNDPPFSFWLNNEIIDAKTQEKSLIELIDYLQAIMTTSAAVLGLVGNITPSWNQDAKQWEVNSYPVQYSSAAFGTGGPINRNLDLKIEVYGDNSVALCYGNKQYKSLDALQTDLTSKILLENFGRLPLFKGMPIEIENISDPNHLKIEVSKTKFELTPNATTKDYDITIIGKISPEFLQAKREAVTQTPEFIKLFEDFEKAGEKLSMTRGFLDLLHVENPDSTNHYWQNLCAYKKYQILQAYEDELKNQTSGSATISPSDFEKIYQKTVGTAITDLQKLPGNLLKSQADETAYSKYVQEFAAYGYKKAYKDRYTKFQTSILDPDKFDYVGPIEKSNRAFQAIRFHLEKLWYDRTKEFKSNDNLNTTQEAYCQALQDFTTAKLQELQTNHPDGSWFSNWVNKTDFRITEDEFEEHFKEFKSFPSYEKWQAETGLDENLETTLQARLPLIAGSFNEDVQKSDLNRATNVLTLTFKDGTTATINLAAPPGTPALNELTLTETRIDNLVGDVEHNQKFNQLFDSLESALAGIKFDFRDSWIPFMGGNPAEAWKALVEYKKGEALEAFKQDLRKTMNDPAFKGNTIATATEVNRLFAHFEELYLVKDLPDFQHDIETEITTMISSKQEIPKPKFTDWSRRLSNFDYEQEYRDMMEGTRAYLALFDYDSPQTLNKAMNLIFKYTGFLRNAPATTPSARIYEELYYMTVQREVNTLVRKAAADGEVKADEMPDKLGLDNFEDWKAKVGPIPPTVTLPATPISWEQLNQAIQKRPEVMKAAADKFGDVYDLKWVNKAAVDSAHHDATKWKTYDNLASAMQNRYLANVLFDVQTEAAAVADYEKYLTTLYPVAHAACYI